MKLFTNLRNYWYPYLILKRVLCCILLLFFSFHSVWGQTVYYDFDAQNDQGFTTENFGNTAQQWERGIPSGGTNAPSSANSPPYSWGTNMNGNQALNVDYAVVSPPYVVTATTVEIDFFEHVAIDDGWHDQFFEYRVNGGTWIQQFVNDQSITPWTLNENVISGFTPGDIVEFRWRSTNDGIGVEAGWYFDDLTVRNVVDTMRVDSVYEVYKETSPVLRGEDNAEILHFNISVPGVLESSSLISAEDFYFNTAASDNAADIEAVRLYYLPDGDPNNAVQVGSEVTNPSGVFSFHGNIFFTNFGKDREFRLVYDVSETAQSGNNLDAQLDSVLVHDTMRYPSVNGLPGTRQILQPLSGNFTIGQGENFETITEALDELYFRGIDDDVNFILTDQGYGSDETFPIVIEEFFNLNDDVLTFRPDQGVEPIITGNAPALFYFKAPVSNVTIDGSADGSGSRDLTLNNTSNSSNSAVAWMESDGTRGVEDIILKNLNISGGSWQQPNTAGVFLGSDLLSFAREVSGTNDDGFNQAAGGVEHKEITIENNHITNAHHGIYAAGTQRSRIKNLTIEGNTIGDVNDSRRIGWRGIVVSYAQFVNVRQNHIHNLYQDINESVRGIHFMEETSDGEISGNIIHNLESGDTFDSGQGIWLADDTENIDIVNNVIFDLRAENSTSNTISNNPFGIVLKDDVSNINIYHNTIVNDTDPQSGNNVGALLIQDNVNNVSVLNNILQTTLSGQTNYGIFAEDLTSSDFIDIDYNIYFSDDFVGRLNNSSHSTLSAWQSATGDDANSIDGDPEIFDKLNDLRPLSTSPAVGGGTPISSVTTDINGEPRSSTAPYIGAYESAPPANDAAITDISGVNIVCDGVNTMEAEVTNFGVNTLQEVTLSWTVDGVNQGDTTYTGLNVSSGNAINLTLGNFNFSQGVSYELIAATSQPNGVNDDNPDNDTLIIEDYKTGLAGVYSVGGSAADFNSITEALENLSRVGLCANTTLELVSSEYSVAENFPLTIEAFSTAGNDTLTIKPGPGNTPSIIGGTTAIFKLESGVSNVIIDGSNDGSNNRDLTIDNNNSGLSNSALFWLESDGNNGVSNVAIKNLILNGSDWTELNTTGIFAGDDLTGLERTVSNTGDTYTSPQEGAGHSNLIIDNNHIYNAHHGIYAAGTGSDPINLIQILNNELGNEGSGNNIGWRGIALTNADSFVINGNHIHGLYQPYGESVRGIHLMGSTTNGEISSNKIHDLESGDSFDSGQGIWLADNASQIDIVNNVIYDLKAEFSTSITTGNNPYGIVISDNSNNINLYHNTIASTTNSQTGNSVGALLLQGSATDLRILNNIFMTTLDGQTNYAVYANALNSADFIEIDHNVYFSDDNVGVLDGTTRNNLSDWQSATGDDANSLESDPELFEPLSDLRPFTSSPVVNAGTPLPSVTTDIDGNPRSSTAPFIGAYESHPPENDVGVTGIIRPFSGQLCGDVQTLTEVSVKNFGIFDQSGFDVSVEIMLDGVPYDTITTTYSGTLSAGELDTIQVGHFDASQEGTITLKGYTQLAGDMNHENDTSIKSVEIEEFVPAPNVDDQVLCGDSVSTTFSVVPNADFIFWYDSTDTENPIDTGNTFNTGLLTETTTFFVRGSNKQILSAGKEENESGFGWTSSGDVGLQFDANSIFTLRTVTIYPEGTANLEIQLQDQNSNVLESKIVEITGANGSAMTVQLDFEVPVGNDHRLVVTNGSSLNDLYRSELGQPFPFATPDNEVVIKNGYGTGAATTRYYYFYDWQIELPGCQSELSSFQAIVIPDPEIEALEGTTFEGAWNDGTQTNPDKSCPGNTLNYEFTSPDGVTNDDYGTEWTITESTVETTGGTPAQNATFSDPTSTENASLNFVPDAAETNQTFEITVTVELIESGCTYTLTRYVNIVPVPDAQFAVDDGCEGTSVSFDNQTTPTGIDYQWDFGDGNSSTDENPIHTYNSAGTYIVTLTAESADECSDQFTDTVEIYEVPIADFNADDVCYGETTDFTNTSSGADQPFTYEWDFDDGNTSFAESPSHAYGAPGSYDVTLITTSQEGCSDTVMHTVHVHENPVADFNADDVCESESVVFDNQSAISTGSLTYDWDFGDGNSSTDENPEHTYSSPGTYQVTLIVQSQEGCTDTSAQMVEVFEAPVANFAAPDECEGQTVSFDNQSSISSGTLNYSWDFDDGNGSTDENPVHTYSSPGIYDVTLVATSSEGCTDTITQSIEIFETPDAAFNADDGCEGTSVAFDNQSVIASGTLSYEWDFDDGNSSTDENPVHTYSSPGVYNVMLITTSNEGCADTTTESIEIFEVPDADFTADDSCEGATINFNNQSSIGAGTLNYDWDFGDGNASTDENPEHTYNSAGTYTVTLIAISAEGCADTTTASVEVFESPQAGFDVQNVCDGEAVSFNNQSTIGSGSLSYNWDFDDGNSSTDENPVHTYSSPGTYNVTLIVTSAEGCTDTVTNAVEVFEVPNADFTADDACVGSSVTFNNQSSISTGSLTYDWDFDDGNSSTDENPVHTYNSAGTYNVTLITTSAEGCADTITQSIEIFEVPVADYTASDVCEGDSVFFNNQSSIGAGTLTYDWNFDDGNSSTDENPAHLYNDAGSYNVTLIVTSQEGCSDTITNTVEVFEQPVADFAADDACEGATVAFDNLTATGTATPDYDWDFGDGNSSTDENPDHTYSSPGTYTVTLIASLPQGCADTTTQTVEVFENPQADFNVSDDCRGASFAFDNQSSIGTGTLTYDWDFGDGNSSTDVSPDHVYNDAGIYEATLIATSSEGCTDTAIQTVEVYEAPAVAFTASDGCEGVPVAFDNQLAGSVHYDFNEPTNRGFTTENLGTTAQEWERGTLTGSGNEADTAYIPPQAWGTNIGGNQAANANYALLSPPYIAQGSDVGVDFYEYRRIDAGWHNHYLEYRVNGGAWQQHFADDQNVTSWTLNQNTISGLNSGDTLQVRWRATNDGIGMDAGWYIDSLNITNAGELMQFAWDFDDGNNSAEANPVHTYASSGIYDVTLVATSHQGCTDSVTESIEIFEVPDADFSVADGCAGTVTSFNNQSSGPANLNYNWDFGDGNSSTDENPVHQYDTAGIYTVTLIAASQEGCADTNIQTIEIFETPEASFTASDACEGATISFNNISTFDGAGSVSYNWDFGDGNGSTDEDPVHAYDSSGSYTVTLIATSPDGCSDTSAENIEVFEVPVADFSVDDACEDVSVSFDNQSSGPGTLNYDWDFGDGNGSVTENPVHVYSSPGVYNITLITSTQEGCADTSVQSIEVFEAPQADFTASDECEGSSVAFNNQSSISAGTLTYNWDFDDGNSSTDENPVHVYDTSGTFDVTLIATSSEGCADTVVHSVEIHELPDVAFNAPDACDGEPVNFTNQSSIGSGTLTYDWDFGDGNSSADEHPTHTYDSTGTFDVTLIATSSEGCTDTAVNTVEIFETIAADFNVVDGCEGQSVIFDNQSGSGLTYDWDFGDGNSSTDENPVHTYDSSGVYNVTLVVSTPAGCNDTTIQSVEIFEQPEADFAVANVCETSVVTFNNQSSISTGNLEYYWDFGDGDTSASESPEHVYDSAGVYQVMLVATSQEGCSDTSVQNVNVWYRPEADYTASGDCEGSSVFFDNQSTIDTGSLDYDWDFGDGNTSTDENPVHIYDTTGTFEVTLIATSQQGCADTSTQMIEIYPVPEADFIANDVCEGGFVTFDNQSSISDGTLNYVWAFGDGDSSVAENPTHQYAAVGVYNVTLLVSSQEGCTDTITHSVEVHENPEAAFTAENVCESTSVAFENQSSVGSGNLTYEWNFGDGNTSADENPVHEYDSTGQYEVALIATSGEGCVDTVVQNVEVEFFEIPDVDFAAANVCDGSQIEFDNQSSIGDGSLDYSWDFGDGNTSADEHPVHTYDSVGTYEVTLIAVSDAGCSDTAAHTVEVFENPVADFGYENVCESTTVEFENSSSISSGNLDYTWYFGDGDSAVSEHPVHHYDSAGTYDVTLIASSAEGCSDTVTIAVDVRFYENPVAEFAYSDICFGDSLAFENQTTIDTGELDYNWSFGDGDSSVTENPVHFYDAAGTYEVTLIAVSEAGCSDTVSHSVEVYETPEAGFAADDVCIGSEVAFNDTSKYSDNTLDYNWTFGDGNTSSDQNPVHLYDSVGTYNVSLVVTTPEGCSDSVSRSVEVHGIPEAAIDDPGFICDGDSLTFTHSANIPGDTSIFYWDFGDGNTSQDPNPRHAYADTGIFEVTLITESGGGCVDTASITVEVNESPDSDFLLSERPNIAGVYVEAVSETHKSYEWNFGDGTVIEDEISLVHRYDSNARYYISLTVTDTNGCTSTTTDSVDIGNVDITDQWRGSRFDLVAYPNPFTDLTTIRYKLDEQSQVGIELYDLRGRKIADVKEKDLVQAGVNFTEIPAGTYGLEPGTYLVRVLINDSVYEMKLQYLE